MRRNCLNCNFADWSVNGFGVCTKIQVLSMPSWFFKLKKDYADILIAQVLKNPERIYNDCYCWEEKGKGKEIGRQVDIM